MQIHFVTGKPPKITMTAAETRGLRSTVEVLLAVRKHLEEPFDPTQDNADNFNGTAAMILEVGFGEFVDRYAPAEPVPEPPDKGKGAKQKGTTDGA